MNNHQQKHQSSNKTKQETLKTGAHISQSAGPEGKTGARPRSGLLKAKAPSPAPTQPAEIIKVGLDMGLKKYVICRQVDGCLAEAPVVKNPAGFQVWVLLQKTLSRRVVVCYEAGLFGFQLARWIISQGMECVVMSPVKLDEANKRVETDMLNARDICSRLDRYLAGNTRALTACRIPTREEELARLVGRQRQQLVDDRKALAAQGRCLLWQFGHLEETSAWWEECHWKKLEQQLNDPPVLAGLRRLRPVLLKIKEQLEEVEKELAQQAPTGLPEPLRLKLPFGVGWLSMLLLSQEVMDWERFDNRRQVAGFCGLVPSESSTGQSVRRGSITKVGNPRIRALLIEMAWRMVRYQPNYRAVKAWGAILHNKSAGSSARKRAIVAVARILAVDLWRLSTGQTTLENLGFI